MNFLNLIFYVVSFASLFVVLYLFSFIFFKLSPEIGPRPIKDEELKEKIRKEGILHATNDEGMRGILKSQKIKCSKGINNYSNLLVPCVYFSPCNSLKSRKSNYTRSYTKVLEIIPSEEQMDKFKLRRFDGSLVYEGDFKLSEAKSFECKDYVEVKGHCFLRICTEVRRYVNYSLCELLAVGMILLLSKILSWLGM